MTKAIVTKDIRQSQTFHRRGRKSSYLNFLKRHAHRAERRWVHQIVKTENWDAVHKPRLTNWEID